MGKNAIVNTVAGDGGSRSPASGRRVSAAKGHGRDRACVASRSGRTLPLREQCRGSPPGFCSAHPGTPAHFLEQSLSRVAATQELDFPHLLCRSGATLQAKQSHHPVHLWRTHWVVSATAGESSGLEAACAPHRAGLHRSIMLTCSLQVTS